jgi:phosphoadenosine phosphosulfate reductase
MEHTPSPQPAGIIVAFSGGKDSLAVLDLCAQRFQRVEAFFMFWVCGLHFQEATLQWAEQRYGIKIYRVPHFDLPALMDDQALNFARPSQRFLGRFTPRQLDDHVRRHFKLTWIASGERKCDSLQRRGMLSAAGPWDQKRLHHYPIAEWAPRQVLAYLRAPRIPLPAEYGYLHRSLGGFRGEDLAAVAKHFPDDYQRILQVFPFVEAIRERWKIYGRAEAEARRIDAQARRLATRQKHLSEVRNAGVQPAGSDGSAVQSKAD